MAKTTNVLVGDHVEVSGLGIGVVTSIWGSFASVDFRGESRHVNLDHLCSIEGKERDRQAKIDKEIAYQKAVQAFEDREHEEQLRLVREERRRGLIEKLRAVMKSDFMKVDSFHEQECLEYVSKQDLDVEKATFVQAWIEDFGSKRNEKLRGPDAEQAAAIAAINGHVQVVARAGSGKTTTLVSRTLFLLRHCGAKPSEILLLAFNRKAALEIRRRLLELLCDGAAVALADEIGTRIKDASKRGRVNLEDIESRAVETVASMLKVNMPHVMTFHALAYAVVHPEESLLFDGPDGEAQGLSRVFQDVIDDHLQVPMFHARIRALMLAHFREDWDRLVEGAFDLNKDDFLRFRRSLPKESLGGEHVKSHGEKIIADFLFEHDIAYKYERNHWWSGVNYRPDFTVFSTPKSGVIIEYFGMKGDSDYDAMSESKKKYWTDKDGWRLIDFYPSDIAELGDEAFQDRLRVALEEHGVACNRLSEDEIWHRVKERAIDRFTKAVVGFIGRCRKRSWSPSDLGDHIDAHRAASEVESQFLDLAYELYAAYLSRLSETGEDDFDGLMQRAASRINDGETLFLRKSGGGDFKALKFACIDEFQDFSDLFYRLLAAIRLHNEKLELFCVGDDWQAINGFAGSDLRYFEDFSAHIGEGKQLHIATNYRSASSIVGIGNALMSGLGKPAVAHKDERGSVWISDLTDFEPTLVEKQRHPGDAITPVVVRLASRLLNEDKDVVLLCRRNGLPWFVNYAETDADGRGNVRFLNHVRSFFPKDLRNRITISTAHKYKGLEKAAVIATDIVARSYPLIHPDWVFSRVFGDNPSKIAKEERRLLYVALTRAIDTLVIVTDGSNKSPFLEEIQSRRSIDFLNWRNFPAVCALTDRRLLVQIKSLSNKLNSGGTYPIKDLLHANRYLWHSANKTWEKSFPESGFDLCSVQSEVWAQSADGVMVTFFDDAENQLASYLVNAGKWECSMDRWSMLKAVVPM
jgi:DNA helicase-4